MCVEHADYRPICLTELMTLAKHQAAGRLQVGKTTSAQITRIKNGGASARAGNTETGDRRRRRRSETRGRAAQGRAPPTRTGTWSGQQAGAPQCGEARNDMGARPAETPATPAGSWYTRAKRLNGSPPRC